MKVLYLTSSDDKYGAPRSLMDMIIPLKNNNGVVPVVFTGRKGKLQKLCSENDIEEHIVGNSEFMIVGGSNLLRKLVKHSLAPLWIAKYLLSKKRCLNRIDGIDLSDIELIHTNINRVDIGAEISARTGIRHIWHLREFSHEDYNCMTLKPGYIKYMNSHSDAFIAISNAVKKAWIKKGIDPKKIYVINDGIESNGFKVKSNYRKSRKDILRIVFCGLVSETKGQKTLIDAVARMPYEYRSRIRVDFWGGGRNEYIRKLERYIHQKGLDNTVKFRGYSNELKEILSDYDIGVVASRAEALGRVTVEYMYAGLYVIASDTGANPDILSSGKYGSLFKQGDPGSLAKELIKAMNGPELCREKAILSRQMAVKRFSVKKSAKRVKELYDHIASLPR